MIPTIASMLVTMSKPYNKLFTIMLLCVVISAEDISNYKMDELNENNNILSTDTLITKLNSTRD